MAADVDRPTSEVGAGLIRPQGPPLEAPPQVTLPRETVQSLSGAGPLGLLGGGGQDMTLMRALLGQPMSVGQSLAAALAGGVSSMRNQSNPVIDQYNAQQKQQQAQAQMMQRVQEQKQAREDREQGYQLDILKSFADSDSPEAQKFYQQGMSRWSRQHGVNAAPEFFAKRAQLTETERDRADALIAGGASDAEILAVFPKIARIPGYLEGEKKILANDGMRRALGIKGKDALELEGLTETRKLKREKDKLAAQSRIDGGIGTVRDYAIVAETGDINAIVSEALKQSLITGQPIPADLAPYVKAYQREQHLKGYTNKYRMAMEAADGDPAKAAQILQQDKKAARPTAAEFEFNLGLELQQLRAKERGGVPLTPKDRIRMSAIRDYLAPGGAGSGESVSTTEKRVPIKAEDLPALQGAVDEVTSRLTTAKLLPNDKSPYVVIQGQNVPKARIVAREYERAHPGWKVTVQWDPNVGKFVIVDRVQTTSTTRTKGPARKGPLAPPAPADESDDSED